MKPILPCLIVVAALVAGCDHPIEIHSPEAAFERPQATAHDRNEENARTPPVEPSTSTSSDRTQ